MMIKLNRFLFFPLSPSPPPPPNQWVAAALTTITLVGAAKVAALVLAGALFVLSLIFFTGPTLTVLYWIALSCFYFCVFLLGLLYYLCRWIFIALAATCACLLHYSDSAFSGDRRYYRPLLSENRTQPETRYVAPRNRPVYGTYTQSETRTVPPRNRPEYGTYTQPESRSVPRPKNGNHTHPANRGETKPNSDDNVCTDRQEMKKSAEYRRAMEAEWAARQRELLRQAEEAQRQRSKRAENKSAKANERRQKQRTDQQKPETSRRRKDETNLKNQKEKYREEIRKKLREVEKCVDMPSLLRSLGVHIPPQPSPNEVRSAYKKACLRFHPDRLARADMRHRIEGEEKFKLISDMKHKCSL